MKKGKRGRRAHIAQKYFILNAYRMASAGKSYAEILIKFPLLSRYSKVRVRKFMGHEIRHPEILPLVRVMKTMRADGHSYAKIASTYGQSYMWAYRKLKKYGHLV